MGKQSTRENKTIYQICREEAARTCPVCAAPVQEGDAYCRECGSKL